MPANYMRGTCGAVGGRISAAAVNFVMVMCSRRVPHAGEPHNKRKDSTAKLS